MALELSGSVGANADNFWKDVLVVQTLLGVILAKAGRTPPWVLTAGQDTPELRAEILAFQRKNTPFSDGRIDRGGTTWKTLLAKAQKAAGGLLPPIPEILPPGPNPSTGRILRGIGDQDWQQWSPPGPLLSNPQAIRQQWPITFQGAAQRPMVRVAYLTPEKTKVRAVGVAWPEGIVPSAYLIYFRHTAKPEDYPNIDVIIKKGIGDHFVGRSQLPAQISASGKDVAVILPMGVGGLWEFTHDEAFIATCLEEIDHDICGFDRLLPPLLVACYSDGIGELDKFLTNCTDLASSVAAVYDMDGALVSRFRHVTFNGMSNVFRYVGTNLPQRFPKEDDAPYLNRTMAGNPAFVPLPKSRWKAHPKFREDKGGDMWWLHHYIPSCMLQHGLASTFSI